MKGQKTPGSGRKKGTPNRYTREVRDAAGPECPKSIAFFARTRDDESLPIQARLYAANALLDRGIGKPSQDVNVRMAEAQDAPDYFAYLPPERLQIITGWLAEAKAAMRRGDPRPGDIPPRQPLLLGAPVLDVEPTPDEGSA